MTFLFTVIFNFNQCTPMQFFKLHVYIGNVLLFATQEELPTFPGQQSSLVVLGCDSCSYNHFTFL